MKKVVSILMMLVLILGMSVRVNAISATADVTVSADKTEASKGDEIVVTVDWKDAVEAVDLELEFDFAKLDYVSSSIAQDYIAESKLKDNIVKLSWFTADVSKAPAKTNVTFTFKAKEAGKVNFKVAKALLTDGDMNTASKYNLGSKEITIKEDAQPETPAVAPLTEKPTTIPQAGYKYETIATAAFAGIMISAVAIAYKKISK